MNFDFLTKADTTGDLERAVRRCNDAKKQLDIGFPNQCIDFYNQALNIIIKNVYKRESLPAPNVNKPENGPEPTPADYMDGNSPFAKWLNNQELINKCHSIRKLRNSVTPAHNNTSKCNATKEMAIKVGKDLEEIARCVCDKLSPVVFRNPEDFHQPCVILLDVSGSMLGAEGTPVGSRPIDELNEAIKLFKSDLVSKRDAYSCSEVCFISFNEEVEVLQSFKYADKLNIPVLTASGMTAMNEAIIKALDVIKAQKAIYAEEEVSYYRPWIYLLSDGLPTDDSKEKEAKDKLREAIEGKHVVFYPVKIGRWANENCLKSYYPDSCKDKIVISAANGHFKELFQFFSNSISESIRTGGNFNVKNREYIKGITVERYSN